MTNMTKKSAATERCSSRGSAASGVESAVVTDLAEPGRVLVRPCASPHAGEPERARLAQIAGYRPSAGDRVLVVREGEDVYVIAVLHAASPPALVLPDGATASTEGVRCTCTTRAGDSWCGTNGVPPRLRPPRATFASARRTGALSWSRGSMCRFTLRVT